MQGCAQHTLTIRVTKNFSLLTKNSDGGGVEADSDRFFAHLSGIVVLFNENEQKIWLIRLGRSSSVSARGSLPGRSHHLSLDAHMANRWRIDSCETCSSGIG